MVDTSRETLFALATANRLLAADLFAGLSAGEWRTPSLCAGWTVREVAAFDSSFGHAHAIVVEDDGVLAGAADPRAVVSSCAAL